MSICNAGYALAFSHSLFRSPPPQSVLPLLGGFSPSSAISPSLVCYPPLWLLSLLAGVGCSQTAGCSQKPISVLHHSAHTVIWHWLWICIGLIITNLQELLYNQCPIHTCRLWLNTSLNTNLDVYAPMWTAIHWSGRWCIWIFIRVLARRVTLLGLIALIGFIPECQF